MSDQSAKSRLLSKATRDGDCLVWNGGMGSGGYGTFHYNGKNRSAHRVSYELHKGPIPAGAVVMHTCDNRRCINPEHLQLGTHTANMKDMRDKGRARYVGGTSHPNAKASPEIAAEIRRRYVPYSRENGSCALAREFGLDQSTVHTIIRGDTWRNKP